MRAAMFLGVALLAGCQARLDSGYLSQQPGGNTHVQPEGARALELYAERQAREYAQGRMTGVAPLNVAPSAASMDRVARERNAPPAVLTPPDAALRTQEERQRQVDTTAREAEERAVQTYALCARLAAHHFAAATREPAEAIAIAAMETCSVERRQLVALIRARRPASEFPEILDARLRTILISQVVQDRAAAAAPAAQPTAPRLPRT